MMYRLVKTKPTPKKTKKARGPCCSKLSKKETEETQEQTQRRLLTPHWTEDTNHLDERRVYELVDADDVLRRIKIKLNDIKEINNLDTMDEKQAYIKRKYGQWIFGNSTTQKGYRRATVYVISNRTLFMTFRLLD